MEAMALIEIDGLPFLKMVIFHGELLNNQMVYSMDGIPFWGMIDMVNVDRYSEYLSTFTISIIPQNDPVNKKRTWR